MTPRIALSLTVLLAASSLSACGGDDPTSTCEGPVALTQGTWCITPTSTSNDCAASLPAPYWVTLQQTGATLQMTSQFGIDYVGSLCGSTGAVHASGPPADVAVSILFTGAGAGSGSARWNTGSCRGTDTFTATAGTCP